MRRIPHLGSIILGLALISLLASVPPAGATWSLVWSDEFDGSSLDTGNWTIDQGNGCPSLCGWGNNELEWYRPQNVAVTDGNLVLTAKDENYGSSSFTSGKVHTRDKRSFRYGRVEMRAKLPVGGGLWPAFWMMPQDDAYGGWAASGEIDIMESSNAMTSVGGALHYGGQYPDNTSTSGSTSLGGASFSDDFHVYAVEWEASQIRWYVDGTLFMTRSNTQWWSSGATGNAYAPFDQPFYIILNLAVGGWYTGCTSTSCVTAEFPQQYLIDYVRVYEDIENFEPTVELTTPADGAELPAGDIVLTATAADSDGSIATVEFYVDDTLLGEDTSAPYAWTWTNATDGCYRVTARARDDLGGEAEDSADITVGTGCGQAGYLGGPSTLPGRIEAENYDIGGPLVAYEDADAGNNGGAYRPGEGVDLEACTDAGGGYNVGWTAAGEWLEYTVAVPRSGQYLLSARVSSLSGGGRFRVDFGGEDKTGEFTVDSTTGWQTWTSLDRSVQLEAGTQVMRVVLLAGGFNLNWIEIASEATPAGGDPQAARPVLHPCSPNPFNPSTTLRYELPRDARVRLAVYDVSGKLIRTLVAAEEVRAGAHQVVWDGRDESGRSAATGVYFARLRAGEDLQTQRMTLVK